LTAEIALMNLQAVALAADSAVSINEGGKVFLTANKIFALSKFHPVGMMIYGSASFMGVPWETLIKFYRKELGRTRFDDVDGYVKNLIDFLCRRRDLFPQAIQQEHVYNTVGSYFEMMRKDIMEKVKTRVEKGEELSNQDVQKIANKTIKDHLSIWRVGAFVPGIDEDTMGSFKEGFTEKYSKQIQRALDEVMEKLPIGKIARRNLDEIAVSLFVKFADGMAHPLNSGVVIAGFGDKQIFPCLKSLRIEGMAGDVLKFKMEEAQCTTLSLDGTAAAILPFAQQEMVHTFMQGVDPLYSSVISRNMSRILAVFGETVIDQLKTSDKVKGELKEKIGRIRKEIMTELEKQLSEFREKYFSAPIASVVSVLPKEDLATMAESLVHLTSLKRRVSLEAETVAGPIDVAIISKGDGLIWIKRKHYFTPELNAHFFANYYREAGNEQGAET
jgi:hypothetical protein